MVSTKIKIYLLRLLFGVLTKLSLLIFSFRSWLRAIGARIAEITNIGFLLSFSIPLMISSDELIENNSVFNSFESLRDSNIWVAMILLAVIQILTLTKSSFNSNQLSGYILTVSAAIWAFLAAKFFESGVWNTGITTYSIISMSCLISGLELMFDDLQLEDRENDRSR